VTQVITFLILFFTNSVSHALSLPVLGFYLGIDFSLIIKSNKEVANNANNVKSAVITAIYTGRNEMTSSLWIILAVVIVIVIFALLALRRGKDKKPEIQPPTRPVEPPKKEVKPKEEPAVEKPPKEKEAPKEEEAVAKPEAEEPGPEPAAEEAVEPAPEPSLPGVTLVDEAEKEAAEKLEVERKERKLKRLRQGLAPTRGGLIAKIGSIFKAKKEIDPSLIDELEETLLTSDVGSKTTEKLIEVIKNALDKDELKEPAAVWDLLRDAVKEILSVEAPPMDIKSDKPFTIMVVGVNGTGKTTTIGKLATQYIDEGYKVVLAAGDTFRAAAVNQLEIWGRRAGAEVVKSKEGADPSSVVYEAIKKAKELDADIVIADTAGRLHTKQPLMEELKKIGRVMGKAHEKAPHEVLLVLDATTGQNAISQVAMFKETLELTGLVLTKLDGTAKGGVIIGICHEHSLPVRYIGVGEAKDDLRSFEVEDFVEALFLAEN
jgi:fused signal recognition particle receptor